MSPKARLRASYALMILIITIVLVQVGCTVANQLRDEAFHGSIFHYALLVLFAYMLGRLVWGIARQLYLSQRWIQHFRIQTHHERTKRLQHMYRHWGTETIVVQDDSFVALTIGLIRPRIVISTMVLDTFSPMEIKAILLHERYHCLHYDGAKLFLSSLAMDAFGYLPIVKPIVRFYETWKELFADRYAIQQMKTELHLGNVLLKLAKEQNLQPFKTAVYFAHPTLHYRMMQVIEPDNAVQVPLALWKPLLRTCSLLLLLIIGGDS